MKAIVEQASPIKKKIKVDVSAQEVQEIVKKVYAKIQKKANLKGFRKGKVPKDVLEKQFGEIANQDAVEEIVNKYTLEVLDKENLNPVSQPDIKIGKYDPNKSFTYDLTFEVKPELEKVKYDGARLEKEKVTADAKEVESHIKQLQTSLTRLEPVSDDAVVDNEKVISIDFIGTADGAKFEGSEAKNFIVDVGSGNMLDVIEKQLAGMKVNDNKKILFNYPKDYFNKGLSGKKGEFDITVKEIKKKIVPEINDDFAKDAGPFKGLDDLKKTIKERIVEYKENNEKQKMYRQIIEYLAEKNDFEVPLGMVMSEVNVSLDNLKRDLKAQGKTLEDAKVDVEKFIETMKPDAELRVKGNLVLEKVCEVENITVTAEELEERIKNIAAGARQPLAKVKKHFEDNRLYPGLEYQMRNEKALDLLLSKSKIKEVKPKKAKDAKK